jgi:hypothetical protein
MSVTSLIAEKKNEGLICVAGLTERDDATQIRLPDLADLLQLKMLFNVAALPAGAEKPALAVSVIGNEVNDVVGPRLLRTV